MSLETDIYIDRNQLKRRLASWRLVAILAIISLFAIFVGRDLLVFGRQHVAIINIDGFISTDTNFEKSVRALAMDTKVSAVIVNVNSPGGETAASESLYEALRSVGEKKPLVAVMGGVAASGGYMAAIAADQIFARKSTITGSIGVVLQTTNIVGLMQKIGVENEIIRSGPLKARPNPLEPFDAESRLVNQKLVDDVEEMFKNMIIERRGLERELVDALSDGRVYSGKTAHKNGLIDSLGGISDARTWLNEVHGISETLPEWLVVRPKTRHWLDWIFSAVSQGGNIGTSVTLDGLVSVWQPFDIIK